MIKWKLYLFIFKYSSTQNSKNAKLFFIKKKAKLMKKEINEQKKKKNT